MTFAYKAVENKGYEGEYEGRVADNIVDFSKFDGYDDDVSKFGAVVSFILVANGVLGLRECSHLVRIADETGCLIRLVSGKKSGSTMSILSLANLGIVKGKSLVLSIHGARNEEAFREAFKVISGETDSNEDD